ncbi:hypothetical protein Tco_1112893 [Tanacetum coccineum]|uniref:Reverse transcriptase domain-containing protein n=1 Tax=Tanacetum coccineum TaxID=301880 RepID=A0ABQ5IS41_9ASTR
MDDMTSHHTKYTSPTLTPKVFANMRRVGKGFSGNETPLFDNMLVQPQTQADKDVEMPVAEEQPPPKNTTHSSPYDSPLTGVNPPRSEEGSLQLAELMALCTSLQRKVILLERGQAFCSSNSKFLKVVVKPAETGVSAALDVEVSATDPAVTTVSSLVTTDSVTITVVKHVSVVAKELTDNDMTMAEALAILKTSKPKVVTTIPILNSATTVTTTKPKAKGITIQEPLDIQKMAVSFISSSEGKAIMIKSEKPVRIKDLSAHDEQVAKDLHDKIQIDVDQELAARMTLEEHEKYTVEERARMLAEFIKNRKKQFTHAQLKHIDFEEIQGLYNKEKELVDTFVPIGSEEDERRIKDLNTKVEEVSSNKDVDNINKRKKRIRMKRSSKKQKTDADLKEEEQLNTFLSIVPNVEEAIDYEVLDKRYQIVDWKSEFYHNDRYGEPHDYYRVFRADRSSRYIKTFTEMVSRFDRMDFLALHSLVMQRFKTKTPEGIDLILWGDLKTMFEANAADEL